MKHVTLPVLALARSPESRLILIIGLTPPGEKEKSNRRRKKNKNKKETGRETETE
jgi:hypothetical protein